MFRNLVVNIFRKIRTPYIGLKNEHFRTMLSSEKYTLFNQIRLLLKTKADLASLKTII